MKPQPIPLRPDPDELVRRDFQIFRRTLAAHALGRVHDQPPDKVVRKAWPDDHRTAVLTRAAVPPTDMTNASAVTGTKTSPLLLVAPSSAAARLFQNCVSIDLAGLNQVFVPHVNTRPLPLWVAEGVPIPWVQPSMGKATIGPVKKLAFGVSVTDELNEATPETAAAVMARLLGESAAKALDTYVFDAVAADSTRPAGLLNGVTPLTASTTGASTIDAMTADVSALAAAIAAAGINPEGMVLVCNPREGISARMLTRFEDTPVLPVYMSLGVAAGTVIACAPTAIASAYEGVPEIETTKHGEVYFEDTSPTAVPGAGPTRSHFQQGLIGLRVKVRCAWASLQPGAVQFMTNVKW